MAFAKIWKGLSSATLFPCIGKPLFFFCSVQPSHSRQITHPATFILDREGVVRWRFVEVDYRVRPKNDKILSALEEVQEGA